MSCMQGFELFFSDFWKYSCISEKILLKKEHTKISAKSSRFVSCNHFENGLISDMSEQDYLDRLMETDDVSKSSICNLWK